MYPLRRATFDPRSALAPTQQRVLALLGELADDLHRVWGGGAITTSAYDTAWVAMVRHPQDAQRLAFPLALDWLLQSQDPDGSWSGPEPYTLMPTMAALLALCKAPQPTAYTRQAAARAAVYLQNALDHWSMQEHESVGFEVLAPRLLAELDRLGIRFSFGGQETLIQLATAKLRTASPSLIYSEQSNLIHSLEAVGPVLDPRTLLQFQASNGSFGSSPAATAAMLMLNPVWDTAAAAWIDHLSERLLDGIPGGMPTLYPLDTFELAAVVDQLTQGNVVLRVVIPPHIRQQLIYWLQEGLFTDGASISRSIGTPPDGHNTARVIAALYYLGATPSIEPLHAFDHDTHFACWLREHSPSIATNAQVLKAFVALPALQRRHFAQQINTLVNFLLGQRNLHGFWEDHGHRSPFYATACVATSLAALQDLSLLEQLRPTIAWLFATQSPYDGGWGWFEGSSLEETAYALQVLQAVPAWLHDEFAPNFAQVLQTGLDYVWEQLTETPSDLSSEPRLWRGKELYTPIRVVWATILGVLHHASYDAHAAQNNGVAVANPLLWQPSRSKVVS